MKYITIVLLYIGEACGFVCYTLRNGFQSGHGVSNKQITSAGLYVMDSIKDESTVRGDTPHKWGLARKIGIGPQMVRFCSVCGCSEDSQASCTPCRPL